MYTICKEFSFSASHSLKGLPQDHPCSRDHGHNYVVQVELQSASLNAVSFVVDYRELDEFKQWLDKFFDHRNLNEVVERVITSLDKQTSAERLAEVFYIYCHTRWHQVVAVRVSETPKTWAEYRP